MPVEVLFRLTPATLLDRCQVRFIKEDIRRVWCPHEQWSFLKSSIQGESSHYPYRSSHNLHDNIWIWSSNIRKSH